MDEPLANLSYRSLEALCLQQAKLSADRNVQSELERMALEYKQLAEWQEQAAAGSGSVRPSRL